MAKSKAAKRKRNNQAEQARKSAKTQPATGAVSPPDSSSDAPLEPKSLLTAVSVEELEIAVDVLNTLAQFPGLIKTKGCKDLRASVHDFRQAATTGSIAAEGSNLSGRVSAALADEKYVDARVLLAEMKIRGDKPKLGAFCRMVRELDVVSGVFSGEIKRSPKEKEMLATLDAVLRVCGHYDPNPNAIPGTITSEFTPSIIVQSTWDLRTSSTPDKVYQSVLDKSIFDSAPESLPTALRAIETTAAEARQPPNHYPAILYTSKPNSIPLAPTGPKIEWHDHPVVPGLGLMTDVLSPTECKAIIAAGEHVNFIPDAPLREDGETSILAHNFYWVVDTAFHDLLWSRVASFLPASVNGRLARGINRRFRVYRYVPGAEYRTHIDGKWPPSNILPDDTYVYDSSPPEKKQSSLFTFLLYLNEEFEGGETTFFLPAAREGTLNAYAVKPRMGSVAIFGHGDIRNALLHEGTGVRKGAKYIVRTEVEYDMEPTEQA